MNKNILLFFISTAFNIINPMQQIGMSYDNAELYVWPLSFRKKVAFSNAKKKLLQKNDTAALPILHEFAQNSYPPAYAALSSYFMKNEDWEPAFTTSYQGAILGHPTCQRQSALFLIGDLIYQRNYAVKERYNQAYSWLQKAAQGIRKEISVLNASASALENRELWFMDPYADQVLKNIDSCLHQKIPHNNNAQNNEIGLQQEKIEREESFEGISDLFSETESVSLTTTPQQQTIPHEERIKGIFADQSNAQMIGFHGEKAHQYLQEIENEEAQTRKRVYNLLFQACLNTKQAANLPKKDEKKFAQFFYKIAHKMIDADLIWSYPNTIITSLITDSVQQQVTKNQFELILKLLKHTKKNPTYFDETVCALLFDVLSKLDQSQQEVLSSHASFLTLLTLAEKKINPKISLQCAEFVIKNEQVLIKTGNFLPNITSLLQHASSDEAYLRKVIHLSFSQEKTRTFGLELLENHFMNNKNSPAAQELYHCFVPQLEDMVQEKKIGYARACKLLYFSEYASQLTNQSSPEFIERAKYYLEESLKTNDIDVYIANAAFEFGRSLTEQINAQEKLITKHALLVQNTNTSILEAAWQRLKAIGETCMAVDIADENIAIHVPIIADLYRLSRIYAKHDHDFARKLFLSAEVHYLANPKVVQKIAERQETLSYLKTLSEENEGWASFLIGHSHAVTGEVEFITYKIIKQLFAARKAIMSFEESAQYLIKAKQQGYYDPNFSVDKVYCKIGAIYQGLQEFKSAYEYFQEAAYLQNPIGHACVGEFLSMGLGDIVGQAALEKAFLHFVAASEIEEKAEKNEHRGKKNLLELYDASVHKIFPCGGMVTSIMKKNIAEYAARYNWPIAIVPTQELTNDDTLAQAKLLYSQEKYQEALVLLRSMPADNLEALAYLSLCYFHGRGVEKSLNTALDYLDCIFSKQEYWQNNSEQMNKGLAYLIWNTLLAIKKERSTRAAYMAVQYVAFISLHTEKTEKYEKLLTYLADAELIMCADSSAHAADVLFTSKAMDAIEILLETKAHFSIVLPLSRLFLERVLANKLPSSVYREQFHKVFSFCDEILVACNQRIVDADKAFNSIDMVGWQEFAHQLKKALPIYQDPRLELLLARVNTFLVLFSHLNNATKQHIAHQTIELLERLQNTDDRAKTMLCELYTHRCIEGPSFFPVNHKKAYQMSLELAEHNNCDALIQLGKWLELEERGVNRDIKKAEEYYKKALAVQPDSNLADYYLTRLYFRYPELVNFDYQYIYRRFHNINDKALCKSQSQLYQLALMLTHNIGVTDLPDICKDVVKMMSYVYALQSCQDDIIIAFADAKLDEKIINFCTAAIRKNWQGAQESLIKPEGYLEKTPPDLRNELKNIADKNAEISDAEKLDAQTVNIIEGQLKLIRGLHCMVESHLIKNPNSKREQLEKGIGLVTESCQHGVTVAALSLVTYESWMQNKDEIVLRNGAYAAAKQAALTNDFQNSCYVQLKKVYTMYMKNNHKPWFALEDLEKRYANKS